MSDQLEDRRLSEMTDRIAQYCTRRQVPALVAGVVDAQQLIWSQGFTGAQSEESTLPDADTLFRVASITKTFTATAILQLRDAGKLSLDDRLSQHLPEFGSALARGGSVEGVTLRRMLCHHAGLTTEAPLPCWDALEFPSRASLLQAIPRIEVVIPQESAFKYSNLAFALLGEVVSRIARRPYGEYLDEEILEPLDLRSTALELDDALRSRLRTGYSPGRYEDQLQRAPYVPLNGLSACGGLHSSLRDLARWIAVQFCTDAAPAAGRQVLAGRSIEESHRPQRLESDWSVGYCLAWRANRFADHIYHGHGGGIYGYASQILFSKSHQLGVICLANVWPHAGLLDLARDLLDRAIAARRPVRAGPIHDVPTPDVVRDWLGTYVAGPGIAADVVFRENALRLVARDESAYSLHVPAVLESTDQSHGFVVRGGRGSGERLVFAADTAAGSARFELGGFVYRRQATHESWT